MAFALIIVVAMAGVSLSLFAIGYGATRGTAGAEARVITDMLALGPWTRVLDVGSGSGWPWLYRAGEMGCDVTLTDLPITGLRIALKRARADSISGICWGCVADAAALPFRYGVFDAVTHSDVLCCLPEKLDVLKACRRVVRDSGKMVFSVILIAPDVPADAYEQAQAGGPPFIASDTPYPELLRQAGWQIADHWDLTADYQTTVTRRLSQLERHADEIARLFGDADAANERARRRATLDALDQRLVRRELFAVMPAQAPWTDDR